MDNKHFTLDIVTQKREQMIDISSQVSKCLEDSGISNGIAVIFCPHTTAAITINENADPDVVRDIIYGLNKIFPNSAEFKHFEGNSDAHLKASTIGMSETIIVENGRLLLGRWQGIYFCEFDGARNRKVHIKIIEC
jgi:secondary thiamine-phosphate synthase enzyme